MLDLDDQIEDNVLDMNQFENCELSGYNPMNQRWRFVSLSGIKGNRSPNDFRVDSGADEDISDYQLWIVSHVNKKEFIPIRRIEGAYPIYS